jgi:tRNA (guanine-N7-)-methyltransferase
VSEPFRIPKRGRSQVRGRGTDYVAYVSRFEVTAQYLQEWPPDVIEVGFGTGESVLALAGERPDTRILAVDIYERGAAKLLRTVNERGLENVAISSQDARTVLDLIGSNTVSEVRVFFPDPWPKRKHRERRLVQPDFVARVIEILRPGGIFWLATDTPDYATHVQSMCAQRLELSAVPVAPDERPPTKYSRRADELGHPGRDFIWRRA